ncbi:hypothetical protein BU16DRAFT_536836 [Lophium mytilinum]|uniref:Uncharacterized protein n=1 Tax=Lophium mytilinum TaxID=390894 RepID=A0A6A6R2T5_9PEZI|nr:hypothetical protein BU16DRAFT_536836 [Lophium mytilinum]
MPQRLPEEPGGMTRQAEFSLAASPIRNSHGTHVCRPMSLHDWHSLFFQPDRSAREVERQPTLHFSSAKSNSQREKLHFLAGNLPKAGKSYWLNLVVMSTLPKTPVCAGDSPLSITANIFGILTFAYALIVGGILYSNPVTNSMRNAPREIKDMFDWSERRYMESIQLYAALQTVGDSVRVRERARMALPLLGDLRIELAEFRDRAHKMGNPRDFSYYRRRSLIHSYRSRARFLLEKEKLEKLREKIDSKFAEAKGHAEKIDIQTDPNVQIREMLYGIIEVVHNTQDMTRFLVEPQHNKMTTMEQMELLIRQQQALGQRLEELHKSLLVSERQYPPTEDNETESIRQQLSVGQNDSASIGENGEVDDRTPAGRENARNEYTSYEEMGLMRPISAVGKETQGTSDTGPIDKQP